MVVEAGRAQENGNSSGALCVLAHDPYCVMRRVPNIVVDFARREHPARMNTAAAASEV